MATTYINPIAKEVEDVFSAVYAQTTSFATNPGSAINGMIVSGDAGTGKTYTVKKALKDSGHAKNVEYLKGLRMTAAALYVKLYLNKAKHRTMVFDDFDLIHHGEKRIIIPMLLSACEVGRSGREVAWEVVQKNALMEEHDVPTKFDFEGSIIWITNERASDIVKALPQWKNAFLSRFNFAKCYFSDEQKFCYTIHLIENHDILGKNCEPFPGGYPKSIVNETVKYLSQHYRHLIEITPRQAIKVADTLYHNTDPVLRMNMLQQLWK